jgi:hypothetical protein
MLEHSTSAALRLVLPISSIQPRINELLHSKYRIDLLFEAVIFGIEFRTAGVICIDK